VRSAIVLLVLVAFMGAGNCEAHSNYLQSLEFESKSFRLDGVGLLERDQTCLNDDDALFPCGIRAAEELDKFIAGRAVKCEDVRVDPRDPIQQIGECAVAGVDLGRWLISHGWALELDLPAKWCLL
jgi:endonuclease YncB( thermonuclease family)